ncbi:hypothetical protein JAAARDRAFT_78327 [Jaapia argillacea MUCL 33604]|uniref:L-tryptophan decarboxylase PsiD-like domain-containing protein n=1 Tax=Jaapia argillacea MUCL 33604 TaxID=933084 RepID=A0A067PXU4_9AGAM|nr:hypothetical protein JAAARDRAFT_78327 [Jaapia argillacea MUCL 33604]
MSRHSATLTEHFRKGGWLPASQEVLEAWLQGIVEEVRPRKGTRSETVLLPVVQDFKDFIEADGTMYMGFHQMFEGTKPPYVTDYETLVLLLNKIIQEAPFYGDIGPPIYMIIHQAMNTQGGFTTFLSSKLNEHFKKMFDVWADFLSSPASRHVLHDKPRGWLNTQAIKAMEEYFEPGLGFADIFVCDPKAPHYGFTSWDHFFNRSFRPNIRTLELPDNPNIVNGACESKLYNVAHNVNDFDQFWIKGEAYSLSHMLNHDSEYAHQFVGGTVFQGFLEVTGYHRWHSPATGVIDKIVEVPGTYFAQSPALLGEEDNPFLRSLAFITATTTRTLVFIESDNRSIGLMCFIAIGMTEVSTCEVTVRAGQRINKGDQLGMFHFGGSSHVLLFRPETRIQFFDGYNAEGDHIKVRAAIAGVE